RILLRVPVEWGDDGRAEGREHVVAGVRVVPARVPRGAVVVGVRVGALHRADHEGEAGGQHLRVVVGAGSKHRLHTGVDAVLGLRSIGPSRAVLPSTRARAGTGPLRVALPRRGDGPRGRGGGVPGDGVRPRAGRAVIAGD